MMYSNKTNNDNTTMKDAEVMGLHNNTDKTLESNKEVKSNKLDREEYFLMLLDIIEASHTNILSIIKMHKGMIIDDLEFRKSMIELGEDIPPRINLDDVYNDILKMQKDINDKIAEAI